MYVTGLIMQVANQTKQATPYDTHITQDVANELALVLSVIERKGYTFLDLSQLCEDWIDYTVPRRILQMAVESMVQNKSLGVTRKHQYQIYHFQGLIPLSKS